MMKKNDNEKVVNEATEEKEETKMEEIIVEEKEPIFKKVIKYTLIGLAALATGALGFILGRNTGDDDDETADSEEKTAA